MSCDRDNPPTAFLSYLGGAFWQDWENHFSGNPAVALRAAGYPDVPHSQASTEMAALLKWIEDISEVEAKLPQLKSFYDYEADGLSLLEFLVLTKKFMDGNTNVFEDCAV